MIEYIVLGIVQGLTEFFPVSSSAHLVILQKLFVLNSNPVIVTVALHLGTTLALVIFFFKDLLNLLKNPRLIFLILLVTAITGAIALSGKDFFESLFNSPKAVALSLLATAAILLLARKAMSGQRDKLNVKDALALGIFQGVSVIPGISRSGSTISSLLFRGIKKEEAFKLSFIASIPAVLGAALMKLKDVQFSSVKLNISGMFAGFLVSFLVGLLALWLFKKSVLKLKLHYFAYYCIMLAVVTFIFIK